MVSKSRLVSSLVRYDHNRYSVAVKAARRTAPMRVYPERIVVWCDGEMVAEPRRRFGRGQIAYDPWHYLPVLTRKPGALRNGDPFRNWDLPPALAQIRQRQPRVPRIETVRVISWWQVRSVTDVDHPGLRIEP